ncbi:hypothetical protein BCR34DRAFT_336065 [Clohesyomyces aquaticus]|uniref:Uncharacterized protein n=1 Tax=Clohesyomyces aquaticus TaxID=1231657 RepID=A0A1Y1ZL33_9PLEO|nr:hypothetical protein BCR34DRAFT_336065 [Clohesyomyces aquaticus]
MTEFSHPSWTTPPTNYLGAFLFISGNLLAIYLTLHINLKIYHSHQISSKAANPRPLSTPLLILSGISFITLSYNMLMFLVTSYAHWTLHSNQNSNVSSNRKMSPLSSPGLSDFPSRLGAWMLDSELFSSFAQELVGDGPSVLWTQVAILGTWFWNVWIAGTAKQRGIDSRSMFPFTLLSQILPISFTATLFLLYLQTLRSSPSPSISTEDKRPTPPPSAAKLVVKPRNPPPHHPLSQPPNTPSHSPSLQ